MNVKRLLGALATMFSVSLMMAGSVSAQGTPAASMFGAANLIGGTWKLVTMVTADRTVYGPAGQIFYTIRLASDGAVELTADCNTGGGRYTRDGDTLTISPLRPALMACPAGSIGSQFATMLAGTHVVSWNGDDLILTNAANGTVITLKPALVDVTWQWILPASAGAIDPASYTLAFTADGRLAIGADCNRGMSGFLTSGDQIAVRPIALTRAMCAAGSLSNPFVAQLETAAAYRIGNGQLTLTTPTGDITFTAQPQRTGIAATPVN